MLLSTNQMLPKRLMYAACLSLVMTVAQAYQDTIQRVFCPQGATDENDEDVISAFGSELLRDCLVFSNNSGVNNSDVNTIVTAHETLQNLNVDQTGNASGENSYALLQFEKGIPEWKKTFNKIQYFIIGIYFPTVAILAVIGNVIILIVLRKDVLQSTSSVYLTGLALADVIFLINYSPKTFSAFETVVVSWTYQTFRAYWISYSFPLVSVCHTAAVWVTIFFTVERYVAIACPLKLQKFSTNIRAKLAVAGAYVFAIAVNAVRFSRRHVVKKLDPVTQNVYYSYTFTDVGRDKTVNALVFWSDLVLAMILPFIILIGLNSAIIWHVWLARKNRLKMAESNHANDDHRKSRETQITRMLVSIVIAFLLCNAIAAAGSIWVAINGANSIYTTREAGVYYMFLFGPALYITNPLANCILYAVCSSAMREGIKALFCSRRLPLQSSSFKTTIGKKSVRARI